REANVIESASAQLADLLAQLGCGAGERRRGDQLRSADGLLLRTQEHEVAAMIAQVTRVGRLILQIDLPIALDEGRELSRNRTTQIAELVSLDQAVQRDRGGRPPVRPCARAVGSLALPRPAHR